VGVLRFLLALALALLVHFVGLRLTPAFSQAVNPFVVVLALYALRGGPLVGLAAGVAVGLVEDALSGGLFGLYGCADTVVGFAVATVAQRVVIERAAGVFLTATAAASAQQAILIALQLLLLADAEVPPFLWVVIRALSCGLLAAAWYAGSGQWRRRLGAWRRHRGSRLHFQ
jgi:rod shape-determining protein MreD